MAPHFVCPNTTIIFAPATLQPNSILPRISSLTTLPAILTLKTSPNPWSKINSAEVLLSIQLKITANGCCPSEVSLACCKRFLFILRLLTNRLFPSFNISNASAGVIAVCISFVNVFILIIFIILFIYFLEVDYYIELIATGL